MENVEVKKLSLWKSALKKFQSFMKVQKHSIESIFYILNIRGTSVMPKRDFIDNLINLIQSIRRPEAVSLAEAIDYRHTGFVSLQGIIYFIDKHIAAICTDGMLTLTSEHPIFSEFFLNRDDFQSYFMEWGVGNGPPDAFAIEKIVEREDRNMTDIQTLTRWLRFHKILSCVRDNRMMDVCRTLRMMNCPQDTVVIAQGDPGDAFYIVFEGSLDIQIDGRVINSIKAGSSFGEKALENNAPRSASVISTSSCKLFVLYASDYKNMVALAQAKINSEMVEFLHTLCPAFAIFSSAKIFHMVKQFTKRSYEKGQIIFVQGELSTGLAVIESGEVSITRSVYIIDMQLKSKSCGSLLPPVGSCSSSTMKTHLRIPMATLQAGDIFGDDTCRSKTTNTYGAVASSRVQIIFINIKQACEFFKGKAVDHLMHITHALHQDDKDLIIEHEKAVRQQIAAKKVKEMALRDVVAHHGRQHFGDSSGPAKKTMGNSKELNLKRSASAIFFGSRLTDEEDTLTPSKLFDRYSSSEIQWDKSVSIPKKFVSK